ncbi:hypothetical protein ABSA28_00552 [Candidatus Hepatincolaceae symbiont of Richtersius coronifer]
MKVNIIDFPNVSMDFTTNYFLSLKFLFQGSEYNFKLIKNKADCSFLFYSPTNFIIKNPRADTLYKAKDFYLGFLSPEFLENLLQPTLYTTSPIKAQSLEMINFQEIFKQYKLGVFYNG